MHKRALVRWTLPLCTFVAIGCNSPVDDSTSSAQCEPNPELSVQPRRLATNGENLNRISFNGTRLNRISFNGQNLNRISFNRISFNGQNLNRISFNGQSLNRISFNGTRLNGEDSGVQLKGSALNELVATTSDGKLLGGDALVGTKIEGILTNGESIELTIASFERAADGALAHYGITYGGQNICEEGDDTGMFVPGAWDESGTRHDRAGDEAAISYSCSKGVIAKCVTWGYVPWTAGADLHQTCTRMARADYCGNGVSYTKNDTLIDVFDTSGIQLPTVGDPSLAFEAGWGPGGAVCASRTRYAATTLAGDAKLPSCWSSLPKCGSFDEAKAAGATIGNGSKIQSRLLCD